MKYGETISVAFNIQNNGNQDLRTDEVKITAMSIFQRGEIHKTIGQFRLSPRTIEPGQSKFFIVRNFPIHGVIFFFAKSTFLW